jgi:hypothetical protein
MRILTSLLFLAAAATPAVAQTHASHTAAHDSAHAVMLDDAQHLALHQLLLGRWTGMVGAHGAAHDTLDVRFENDAEHQQLMVRHRGGVSGFEIRGDTLKWKQDVGGSACVAATAVSTLVQAATKSTPGTAPQIEGRLICGSTQTPFTLRKAGP